MKNTLFLAALLLACSCTRTDPQSTPGDSNVNAKAVQPNEYSLEEVPGTNWQRAVKLDSAGNMLETGYLEEGKKVGSWVFYTHSNKQFPSQISTYKEDKLNGLHIDFNEGGQAGLITYYQNNQLHGHWGKYQFGRVAEEADYKNGKLEGVYKIYTLATGALQTTAEYKNGVQDGYYRTYNPDGQITTEYLYKNGERISGGVVNPGSK